VKPLFRRYGHTPGKTALKEHFLLKREKLLERDGEVKRDFESMWRFARG
jgi:hypothetical protein